MWQFAFAVEIEITGGAPSRPRCSIGLRRSLRCSAQPSLCGMNFERWLVRAFDR
jgi:hypothetical protein